MDRTPGMLEVHYALWGVLSIPLGFVGLVFVLPGLQPLIGLIFLAASGLLVVYVAKLSLGSLWAWRAGVAAHGMLVLAAPVYIPAWPDLLAVPLAAASLYSVVVLTVGRSRWDTLRHEKAM